MRVLKVLFIVVLLASLGWHLLVRNHQLSFVPPEMNVSEILYENEKAWGFGPGGNETGLIMYKLPKGEAEKIIAGGEEYLESFPSAKLGKPHSWHGKHREWHSTPISSDYKRWFEVPASNQITTTPDVHNYLNKYGFGIPIRKDIEGFINRAISASGSYYANGRIGMILVIPSQQLVFYIYNG